MSVLYFIPWADIVSTRDSKSRSHSFSDCCIRTDRNLLYPRGHGTSLLVAWSHLYDDLEALEFNNQFSFRNFFSLPFENAKIATQIFIDQLNLRFFLCFEEILLLWNCCSCDPFRSSYTSSTGNWFIVTQIAANDPISTSNQIFIVSKFTCLGKWRWTYCTHAFSDSPKLTYFAIFLQKNNRLKKKK